MRRRYARPIATSSARSSTSVLRATIEPSILLSLPGKTDRIHDEHCPSCRRAHRVPPGSSLRARRPRADACMSLHDLACRRNARDSRGHRWSADRSRREVHIGRGWIRHGDPFLQGHAEHRRARRSPLVHLGHVARNRDVQRRERGRLAGSTARAGRRHRGQYDLHRVVPLGRLLRHRHRLLRRCRCGCSTAARAARGSRGWRRDRRRSQRGLRVRRERVPRIGWIEQLLGRRGACDGPWSRCHATDRHAGHARGRIDGRPLVNARAGDVQRGGGRGNDWRSHLRRARSESRRRPRCGDLRRLASDGHVCDHRRPAAQRDLYRDDAWRPVRRSRPRRQRAGGGLRLVVHHGYRHSSSRRGTRRASPDHLQHVESIRTVLQRDSSSRRAQRVPGDRHHQCHRLAARVPRRRHPRRDAAHIGAGRHARQLRERRRQSGRDAAGQATGRAARIDRSARHAVERLPAGEHLVRARSRHRRRHDPVSRHGGSIRVHVGDDDRVAVQRRSDGNHESSGDTRLDRIGRRSRGGIHLRPRPIHRLYAPGQSRVVGPGARWHCAHPLGRSLLWRGRRRPAARLGRFEQGRDSAGGRAAAAPRQPAAVPEPREEAPAAVLVSATQPEGRNRDDRRRSRQRRHGGALQSVRRVERTGVFSRGLEVHPRNLLYLQRHARHGRYLVRGVCECRIRGCPAHVEQLCGLDAGDSGDLLLAAVRAIPRGAAVRARRSNQPHALHRVERFRLAAEGRAGQRHPLRYELLLLAGGVGAGPAGTVHRLRDADAFRGRRWLGDRRVSGDQPDDR